MKIAVIGAGVMGALHARVISANADCDLYGVLDSEMERAVALASVYGVPASATLDGISGCDAVVIATTTSSHANLASELIQEKIPVLVEKPFADDALAVANLLKKAAKHDVPVMCGFVERFNPAFRCAQEILVERPVHLLFVRHSPKAPTATGNVITDVAIHDIDLALQICGASLEQIAAQAWPGGPDVAEIVDCSIRFTSGALATISSSRWGQRKVRTLTISTSSESIEVDLLRHNVTVYRHVSHEILDGAYRADTIVDIPFVRHAGEPLALQLAHFIDIIEGRSDAEAERADILGPHQVVDIIGQQIDPSRMSH